MRSLFSYLLAPAARWTIKPTFATPEGLHAGIAKSRKNATHRPPASLSKTLDIVERDVKGVKVWDLRQKGLAEADIKGRMMYVHGGSFVLDIMAEHWDLARFFAEKLGLVVSVVLYPLGPESKITETFEKLQPIHDDMAAAGSVDVPFYLAGDSCGGCLALALTQLALQAKKSLASRLILISPLLDQSFTNPNLIAMAPSDPALHLPGLEEARRLVAPDLDPKTDVRVSPKYGPVDGLPPVLLMAAENDLLTPDGVEWARRADMKGDVTLVVGEGMVHCWPIIDFYEAKVARQTVADWLTTPRSGIQGHKL
jgi:acetyl esterase/lipase